MNREPCEDVTSLEAANCMLAQLYPQEGAPLECLLEHSRLSARVYRMVARLDGEQAAIAKSCARREKEASKILAALLDRK